MKNNFFVFDTNALVSSALSPQSTNAQALNKALQIGQVVYSQAIWTGFSRKSIQILLITEGYNLAKVPNRTPLFDGQI